MQLELLIHLSQKEQALRPLDKHRIFLSKNNHIRLERILQSCSFIGID